MKQKKPITLKIFLFLVSTDILETVAQFCFKKTALAQQPVLLRGVSDAFHFIFTAASNPFFGLALISIFTLFCIWTVVLSKVDLSVAVPVASFSYITIPLVSIIFLGERVSLLRWAGIGFIILGVILVSVSSYHQEAC
jgi:drug/metabolite transporter (DMT)-like permease